MSGAGDGGACRFGGGCQSQSWGVSGLPGDTTAADVGQRWRCWGCWGQCQEWQGGSSGDARQSPESQECCGAALGMLQGKIGIAVGQNRERKGKIGSLGISRGDVGGARDALPSAGNAREARAKSWILGLLWEGAGDAGGQCRGCCRADLGTLQGRFVDAAGQSQGYCRAEPGIPGQSRGFQGRVGNARTDAGVPGMPWGNVRDAGGSAGDVAGQCGGFRGCRGAVPGMQESAPGIKRQIRGSRGCRGAAPGMQEPGSGMPGMLQG